MDPRDRERCQVLLGALRRMHDRIRDTVVASCERESLDALSQVVHEGTGDTIFAVDRVSEQALVEALTELARDDALVLVAEGVGDGELVLPPGASAEEATWRIIVDPIDGTRGLMYQKRSAWILTAVAPNRGPATSLRDAVLAIQTEIPLNKQHQSDQVWCLRGETLRAERFDRLTGHRRNLTLRPSAAGTIAYGYASIARFFPGGRAVLAAVDDDLAQALLGAPREGGVQCFEDQYPCTGGQLYELMSGHDRFVADLRPLVARAPGHEGSAPGVCCHPYDICTLLLAESLGVHVTGVDGEPLDVPMDVHTDVAWIGYANSDVRAEVEPVLMRALARHGLMPPPSDSRNPS